MQIMQQQHQQRNNNDSTMQQRLLNTKQCKYACGTNRASSSLR